jgi:hypothetical protein
VIVPLLVFAAIKLVPKAGPLPIVEGDAASSGHGEGQQLGGGNAL